MATWESWIRAWNSQMGGFPSVFWGRNSRSQAAGRARSMRIADHGSALASSFSGVRISSSNVVSEGWTPSSPKRVKEL